MKIFDFDKSNMNNLAVHLHKCAMKGNPLVIKKALKTFNLDSFGQFLEKNMKYANDDRQFDLDNILERKKWFEVIYNEDKPGVYTHSKTRQPLHNDNAWFSDPAEMVFLAFEKQAINGGETTIYELDNILTDLEKEDKQLLNDLQKIQVVIRKDKSGYYFNKTSVIKGEDAIYWNYYRIEKQDNTVKKMCDKFFNFLQSKESTNSVETFKCQTSDILCFNDTKLLHGRLAFYAENMGDRILHQSMWHINN